jgi:hypothetical protein
MLHIDPATLRRHPWIAVLLGFATAAVIGFLLQSGMSEARLLLAQQAPQAISIDQASSVRTIRWVRITDGDWHCDRTMTTERRSWIERLVLGPIETTEIPITGSHPGEVVIACFDGAVSCEARAGSPLTGVIGSRVIFTSCTPKGRWGASGDRVVVLNVGASPRQALVMLVALAAIALLGIGFGAYHLQRMFPRPEGREAVTTAYVPLEPR